MPQPFTATAPAVTLPTVSSTSPWTLGFMDDRMICLSYCVPVPMKLMVLKRVIMVFSCTVLCIFQEMFCFTICAIFMIDEEEKEDRMKDKLYETPYIISFGPVNQLVPGLLLESKDLAIQARSVRLAHLRSSALLVSVTKNNPWNQSLSYTSHNHLITNVLLRLGFRCPSHLAMWVCAQRDRKT